MVAVLSIVFFFLLMGLLTGGAVLCLHLWARRKFGVQARILLAAVLGPGSILVFPMLVALFDGNAPVGDMGFGLAIGAIFISVVIGWPASAILTKKLEKSLLPDTSIFG